MLCIEEFRIVSGPATQFLLCFRLPSGPAFASPVGTARSAVSEATAILTMDPGFRGPRSLPEGITMLRLPWCSTLCSCPAALLPFQAPPLPLLKLLFSLQRHLLAFMFFFKIQAKMTFWEQSYWVSVITIPLSVSFSVCAHCPLLYPPTTSSEKKLPLFTCLDTALPAHWAGQLHTDTQCPGGDSFRG